MRTFIATLCLAVVFAKEAEKPKMMTCAEVTKVATTACTKLNEAVKEAEKKEKMAACMKTSADAIKAGVEAKKPVCTAGASALLAGAAAIATMAALF